MTAKNKRRQSGPTQSEADRIAAGRVQLKVRVSAECRAHLGALANGSGCDLSAEVEHLVAEAWTKRSRAAR